MSVVPKMVPAASQKTQEKSEAKGAAPKKVAVQGIWNQHLKQSNI